MASLGSLTRLLSTQTLSVAIALLAVALPPATGADTAPPPADDSIALGRHIYRTGRLPSGAAIKAVTLGDVPIEGAPAACIHCHLRSGLGGSEGDTGSPPITGSILFRRSSGYRPRPVYTDETLARVMRTGIDPAGRRLNSLMPLYDLSDDEMAGLIAYLKTLSATISPGVTDTAINFATVVTADVDPTVRDAMLNVLEAFFKEKNGGTRAEVRRSAAGPFYREYRNKAYRQWVLRPWTLSGPAESWPAQLDEQYRRQPVFAIISGISTGEWRPIHTFCETNQLPCILPNTDLPVITEGNDFYTMYFSQGLLLEVRAIMKHLAQRPPGSILQVFRPGTPGSAAAAFLRETASADGRFSVTDRPLDPGQTLTRDQLLTWLAPNGTGTLVLWLPLEDLAALDLPSRDGLSPASVYLSSTLLQGEPATIPEAMRPLSLIAHPYALPDEFQGRFRRVRTWLKHRKIPVRHPRVQAQTYFACLATAEGLMHIRRFFYRDYLLDCMDHVEGLSRFSAFYPRLSFGPGQRYLAKGSYILQLRRNGDGASIGNASWIVP